MNRFALWLILLFPALAQAQDKPILVLDVGGHTTRANGLTFTPDGKEIISSSPDGSIRFWNVQTGEQTRVLHLPAYANAGEALALSPNGQMLAVSLATANNESGIAFLSLPEDGTLRHIRTGHSKGLSWLTFSPDGKRLVSACRDTNVRIWDVASGRCEHVLPVDPAGTGGLAFSSDGKYLAICFINQMIRIWEVASGKAVADLVDKEYRSGGWFGIAWSPDGKTLVSGCYGNCLRVWNTDGTLRDRPLVGAYRSMTFTKDSKAVLFAAAGGGYLYDLERKEVRAACTGMGNQIWRVALSPDDRLAVTGGDKGEDLYLWDTANGKVRHRLAGTSRSPIGAAWSPDGKAIAWGGKLGGAYDWAVPGPLHVTHPLERSFDLTALEFGPAPGADWRRHQPRSGSLAVETVYSQGGGTGGEVNVKDGDQVLCTIKLRWSNVFTFLPGERLVLGGWAGVKMYQARTGQLLRSFQSTNSHFALAPSPDNRYLVGTEADQTLRIWKLDRDEPILSLFVAGNDWIAWTPEGYYAASPGAEKLMGWRVNNGVERFASFYPAAQFRKTLYRPDVIKRLLRTGSLEQALAEADRERGATTSPTTIDKVALPVVRITSPQRDAAVKSDVSVTAVAESRGEHPITALRLLVDGQQVAGKDGVRRIEDPKVGEVRASWTVSLAPGKHRLQVLADSAVSQGSSDEITVTNSGEARIIRQPRLVVLAVGVSNYKNANVGKLDYAASDAKAVAAAFEAYGKALFRETKTKLLTDELATRDAVMDGLDWLVKETSQDDYAVVFFAGHGEPDNSGTVYFLPVDADKEKLRRTAVAGEELMKTFRDLPPSKRVLILDACHAGGVSSGKKRAGSSVTDPLVRELLTPENGVVVMCSSTGREFSQESHQHKMGVFTLALTEGLSGKGHKDNGGLVFTHHLHSYVCDRVKELTGGQQHPVMKNPDEIRSFPVSKP